MVIEIYKRFYDPTEAHIISEKLKANNIPCFVTNDISSTLFWQMQSAHGGVNIMLAKENFEKADSVLQEPSYTSIDELEHSDICCPKCQSNHVNFGSRSKKINWWQLLGLLFLAPVPIPRYAYYCFKCGHTFE